MTKLRIALAGGIIVASVLLGLGGVNHKTNQFGKHLLAEAICGTADGFRVRNSDGSIRELNNGKINGTNLVAVTSVQGDGNVKVSVKERIAGGEVVILGERVVEEKTVPTCGTNQ